ncbi:MAG: hypothetical protein QF561_00160 [Phycisphaerales bacterium]|nr:hypothetical protein [Phycisphaerales bacterium]
MRACLMEDKTLARLHDGHTRGTIMFGAACDAVLAVIVTGSLGGGQDGQLSLLPASLAAATAAVSLVVFGGVLNDLLDYRRDEVLGGSSPVPATGPAIIVLVGSLLLAMFAASVLGGDASFVMLVLAALLLFHTAVSRFIPGIGLLVPGALLAGVMLIPDWRMPLPSAVWMLMTIIVATSVGVHILADKRPVLSLRAVPAVIAGWVVMSGVILTLQAGRGWAIWPEDVSIAMVLWPLAALTLLGAVVRWKIATASSRRSAAGKVVRYVSLWQPMLGASWCAAIGAWTAATGFVLVGVAGLLVIGGFREFTGVSGKDPGWR